VSIVRPSAPRRKLLHKGAFHSEKGAGCRFQRRWTEAVLPVTAERNTQIVRWARQTSNTGRRIGAITPKRILSCTVFLAATMALLLATTSEPKADCADSPAPGVDCSGCDLSGADFSNADLHGATLKRANLSGAKFNRADLSNADLRGAYLIAADLSDASLSDTFFSDADPYGAYLKQAELNGVHLCSTTMPDGHVNNSNCVMSFE
jgi:hypothetical protein